MRIEDFSQFYNGIVKFDSSLPIVVTYSSEMGLVYRQLGLVQAFPYLSNYFFPNPRLSLGILMPRDLEDLKKSLELLLQDASLTSNMMNSIIGKYRFDIYKLFKGLDGPQLAYRLNFVTFTNKYISKYILYRNGVQCRLLLKSINNENRKRKNERA